MTWTVGYCEYVARLLPTARLQPAEVGQGTSQRASDTGCYGSTGVPQDEPGSGEGLPGERVAGAGTCFSFQHLHLVQPQQSPQPLFQTAVEKRGLPTIRFHDLRRTFATLMFSNGEHPKIVQEILGHAQITLTLDTYSHILPSMQDGAVGRLGKLLD